MVKNKGFTLIEMMVAIAVFSSVVGVTSSVFVSSLRAQKHNLATYEVLNQTSYVMEYMSRALRMAKKDTTGACTGTAKLNYKFENQCLKFVNYKSECQQFCLEDTQLKNEDGDALTGDNLQINSFHVVLAGENQPPLDYSQPRLTIFLDIIGREESVIKIQTTISQRNPDVQR